MRVTVRSTVLVAGLAALATLVASAQPARPAAALAAGDLVGTWTPVLVERLGAGAEPETVPNPRGLLVFDAAGHALEIVTRGNRVPYAAAQATPAEAQATFGGFGGFWGAYRLDAARRRITYRAEGAVDPNLMGQDEERTYTYDGERLAITSARPHPGAPGGMRWTWDRVPPLETLSPAHRGLVGFWQHVVERRVDPAGTVLTESRRAPSIIVYTPTGHVGVHFPPLGRERFVGALPTDAEARAAIAGYVGYYGVYTLHPGAVFHHRLAMLGPAQGDTLRRFFQIDGGEITLRFPLARFQGQESRTIVVLRRLSGEAEMLGR
jgi:hypothetical protein